MTLSRFGVTNEKNQDKIESIISKPNCQRTKEENETIILHITDQMIQKKVIKN